MDSILAFSVSHGYNIGDIVTLNDDTNRVRRKVTMICVGASVKIMTRNRASKGYRRHVRRMKAKG